MLDRIGIGSHGGGVATASREDYHVRRSTGFRSATTAYPGSAIATERQTDDQIDIFYVDDQGRINVCGWSETEPVRNRTES
ncbi:hypothetical protein J2Z22_004268 [Paenibacillus forsythiae]|uniref:Uncharacterized protein n=1 Tax=Paenibacillus forsythiae TaxID=365616 RepID=A0ABU3HD53_9BACL|nr:hypothetical protein [Paenibacillus forsythiae]